MLQGQVERKDPVLHRCLSQDWHWGDTFLRFSLWGNCEAENGQSWKTQCYREARKDSQNYGDSNQKVNSDSDSDRKHSWEESLEGPDGVGTDVHTGWAGSASTLQRELSITGMEDASLCFIHYFKTFVIPLENPSILSRISTHQVNAVYTSISIANPLHLKISTYFSHTHYTSAHPHKVGIILHLQVGSTRRQK